MEPRASVHPADETLVSYGLGKLDDTLAETVNKHLEQCVPCRRRVAELSSDSFIGRLRDAQPRPGDVPTRPRTIVEPDPPRPSRVAGKQASSAVPPAASDALPPELANHPQYEILRELGRGGMGVVYLARNKLMDRLEVLKVLNKEMLAKQGRADRFLREIQSAARLHHPNVVAAYTALQIGDLLVFAMEYVEGDDLAKLVRARGPLPVVNACYFAYQAAQGLQHAHERGMIHRDIKPGNLILFRDGKKAVVKILDFGLAKVTSERGLDRTLTQEGQMLGTPDYIAPEQTLDAQKADIRADIYSLGCTLYHLLTGSTPFAGNSLFEVLQAHHAIEAKPLNLVRPEVPVELAAVVAKMMAKDPNRRYQTPGEVVQALKPFLKPGGSTGSQPELPRVMSQTARPVAAVALAPTPDDDDPALAPMEAVQPSERWKSLIGAFQFDRSSTARSAIRKRARRQPPWMWPSVVVGALLFGLITAWASGVFSVKTKDGVIVIENLPEQANVYVDGEVVTVRPVGGGKSGEITVRAGDHRVEVKQGDVTVSGENVTIANDETQTIRIRFESSSPVTPPSPNDGHSAVKTPSEASVTAGQGRPGLLIAPFNQEEAHTAQTAWARSYHVGEERTNSLGMKFALIPAGTFHMGAPPSEREPSSREDERPQHRVQITQPFYLGVYEVTQQEFERVTGRDPSLFRPTSDSGKDAVGAGRDTRRFPVETVSWFDAVDFCNQLSQLEGLQPYYRISGIEPNDDRSIRAASVTIAGGEGYRLPTEAQWEYACRAGTVTPFYFGRTNNGREANVDGENPYGTEETGPLVRRPVEVGSYPSNAFGLYDMHGNVWEWCQDWYDDAYYARSPTDDPLGPEMGERRVERGGCYISHAEFSRSSARSNDRPDLRAGSTGFRVAISAGAAAVGVLNKTAE
jgi:serine/threonine protein kinase/formylglycine-generating enzyme required for sulfatase activity